jgi:hypothetical protein
VTVERETKVVYYVVNWIREKDQWVWSSQMSPGFEKRRDAEDSARQERKWFCKPVPPARLPKPGKGAR